MHLALELGYVEQWHTEPRGPSVLFKLACHLHCAGKCVPGPYCLVLELEESSSSLHYQNATGTRNWLFNQSLHLPNTFPAMINCSLTKLYSILIKPCTKHWKCINKTLRNNILLKEKLKLHGSLAVLVKLLLETTEKHKQRIPRNFLPETFDTVWGISTVSPRKIYFMSVKKFSR